MFSMTANKLLNEGLRKSAFFSMALTIGLASTSRAEIVYSNRFDDASSLAGLSATGTVTVSGGQFLSPTTIKSFATLSLSDLAGYDIILDSNVGDVTIAFNVSVGDTHTFNGGFFIDLSSSPTLTASNINANGYSFSGGGYVGNRTLFSYYGGVGVSGHLFDITNGIPDLPSRGTVKIVYRPATDTWTLYMRIDTVYHDPLTLGDSYKVGDVVNNSFTGIPLPYLLFGSSSTYDDIYFDNLSIARGALVTKPSGVTATDGDHADKVTVTWQQSTYATGYRIFRNTSDNPEAAIEIGTVGGIGTYEDLSAVAGTAYHYWVRSENSTGLSDFSAGDLGFRLAPPVKVTGLTASDEVSATHVELEWTLTPYTAAYLIYRGTSSDFNSAIHVHTSNSSNINHWMDSTAPGNQILHYWVRGTNAAGEGALSDPDSGYFLNSPPLAPLDFSASDNTAIDRVLLSWSASEFASAYRIFRSSGNTPESAVEIGATSSTTFDDLSAVSGENYFYWVKAENVVGEGSFGESAAGSRSIATPDLLIGKTAAVKIGDDLFSDTGLNQRVRQISKKGRKLVYFFGIENNGSVSDTFNLTGTSGSSLFRALYRDRTGANVNASVLTGSFRTALEADEQTSLNLEIAPGKGAVGKRKQRIFVIRIVSTEDPLKLDSNQAVAESR